MMNKKRSFLQCVLPIFTISLLAGLSCNREGGLRGRDSISSSKGKQTEDVNSALLHRNRNSTFFKAPSPIASKRSITASPSFTATPPETSASSLPPLTAPQPKRQKPPIPPKPSILPFPSSTATISEENPSSTSSTSSSVGQANEETDRQAHKKNISIVLRDIRDRVALKMPSEQPVQEKEKDPTSKLPLIACLMSLPAFTNASNASSQSDNESDNDSEHSWSPSECE